MPFSNREMTSFLPLPRSREGFLLPPFPSFNVDPEKRLKEIQDLDTRETDILVNAYPKSGSHWLHEILCKLLYDEQTTAPLPRMEACFLDLLSDITALTKLPSPRILYTHLPVQYLPRKHLSRGGKTFHMIRDPRDVVVSSYYHYLSVPRFKSYFTREWDQHLSNFMSGDFIYGDWFQYERQYEQFAKTNNVMTLFYEDMKTDEERATRKIADYLELPLTQENAARIARDCGISNVKERMKTHQTSFMFRKGHVGDWKNHFSADQEKQFSLLFQEKMKGSRLAARYFVLNSSL